MESLDLVDSVSRDLVQILFSSFYYFGLFSVMN